jgi:hypothetical protein
MSIPRRLLTVALAGLGIAATAVPTALGTSVGVDFQNVNLHLAPSVVMEVHRLRGALLPMRDGQAPSFDDVTSYTLHIEAGEVAMTADSLSALLNQTAFAGPESPVSGVRVSVDEGQVKQKGTLRKGLRIPFTVIGDLSATGDGRIRMHATSVKAAGVPAGGVLRLFHVDLADLMKGDQSKGVSAQGNDLILDPSRLLPPPRATGKVSSVRLEGNRIVQVFGGSALKRDSRAGYMHYVGNSLRFGRLTMTNTDLKIVDQDPKDAFEFSPREYAKQLVAGYSKNHADGSVTVYMPDLNDLK